MATVRVEYIGPKPEHQDHLYGTGLIWPGRGSQHDVPESAWEGMAKHTDVYARVEKPAPGAAAVESAAPPATLGSGRRISDGAMLTELADCQNNEQMHEFAARHGLKVDGRKRLHGEGLRSALAAMLSERG